MKTFERMTEQDFDKMTEREFADLLRKNIPDEEQQKQAWINQQTRWVKISQIKIFTRELAISIARQLAAENKATPDKETFSAATSATLSKEHLFSGFHSSSKKLLQPISTEEIDLCIKEALVIIKEEKEELARRLADRIVQEFVDGKVSFDDSVADTIRSWKKFGDGTVFPFLEHEFEPIIADAKSRLDFNKGKTFSPPRLPVKSVALQKIDE